MMFRFFRYLVMVLIVLVSFGCQQGDGGSDEVAETTAEKTAEPDVIAVQHILIAFAGSVPGKNITRTQEEAESLARELFKRAQGGEDFGKLVEEYTDDSAPGIYKMANFGVEADMNQGIFARDRMVQAFGDVGFPLAVGEIGLAEFDPVKSKYGWHIIKRVE
jgi:parvulin-like peptidyl-prolyl isomerase